MPNAHDSSPPLMVPVADVRRLEPTWPYGYQRTCYLIRTGHLGCVRVGRRVFLRRADLEAFVATHATAPREVTP